MKGLRRLCRTLLALARELSGEAAYRRHLAYHQRAHSGEEWRRFADERLRDKYTRPKCC